MSDNLGMVILWFADITDGIKVFAEMCYILEEGSALILRSDEVFKRLEHVIDDNYEWSSVKRVVDDALALILKRRDIFLHHQQISSINIYTSKQIVIKANEHVKILNN